MRRRLMLFAADVNRFGPLAMVSLATFVCLPSFMSFLGRKLDAVTMLERYAVSLLLATIAVRLLSRMVVTYAARNVIETERQDLETDAGSGTPIR
jgi:hypothetical protein